MIFAGFCTLLAFAFLPETYAPVLLQWKAQKLRRADPVQNAEVYAEHERSDWSLHGIIHRTVYRPIQMLIREPILLLVTIYLSLVYGVLYGSKSFLHPLIDGVLSHRLIRSVRGDSCHLHLHPWL